MEEEGLAVMEQILLRNGIQPVVHFLHLGLVIFCFTGSVKKWLFFFQGELPTMSNKVQLKLSVITRLWLLGLFPKINRTRTRNFV
jgi:hypothetical protein